MESYDDSGMAAMGTGIMVLYFGILLLVVASLWKIFTKAGKPGWAAIIPIYNLIVWLEIVNKPVWWIILCFIPIVNIFIIIILTHRLSLSFGQGAGMTVLMLLLPFVGYPILGFGSSTYVGAPK